MFTPILAFRCFTSDCASHHADMRQFAKRLNETSKRLVNFSTQYDGLRSPVQPSPPNGLLFQASTRYSGTRSATRRVLE